eukprot:scaffold5036_cov61-Phaeocystis_antarctica.AAC.1
MPIPTQPQRSLYPELVFIAASLPTRTRLAPLLLRYAEGGWLRPQERAEKALRKAAGDGDLTTLTRLVEQGVNLEAGGTVSATPASRPQPPLLPSPSPPRPRRPPPLLPRPHRRRSPRV